MFQAHGGAIVNISATLQVNGQPMQAHAGSAKAAIGENMQLSFSYFRCYGDITLALTISNVTIIMPG